MSQIRISLLGRVQIIDEVGEQIHLPPIVQNLFAYIILTQYRNKSHTGLRREQLANMFWEDQPERNARRCLSTALWRLRREFQITQPDLTPDFITTTHDKVKLNIGFDHWLDIEQFEQSALFGLGKPMEEMSIEQADALRVAVQLYTGDLLEDCYDNWAIQERERLHLLYLRCLARLMRYYRSNQLFEESVECGKQILRTDPLREQIHRELISLYMENGQRGLAIHQYEMCQQILKRELGIEPMAETKLLYKQLIQQHQQQISADTEIDPPPTKEQLMQDLKKAMHDLEHAQNQLQNIQAALLRMEQN